MSQKNKTEKKPSVAGAEITPLRRASGRSLAVASFSCGTCVMVLEMAGSRVVAPYMGTSLVVWTSLIGIVMASLTLGYWAGGRVSDRRPDPGLLAKIIGGAAFFSLLVGIAANPLLGLLSRNVRNVYVGSVIASICLFAVPSVLLGMVSPFIVRLAMHNLGSAGSTVGKFSALSSAGSILGTFLGGFVLISFLSSQAILFLVAVVLGLTALQLHAAAKKILLPLVVLAAGLGILSEAGAMPMTPDGINIETPYNTIRIMDTNVWLTNREVRILQTDPMGAQSLMYLDAPDELYSDYTKFYDLAFHYKPDAKRVLMLGGGGYCVPRHLGATRPDVAIDVVELDPGITKAARDYFHLADRPDQRIFHEDARMFVNRESARGELKYDAVFEDVFGSAYSIPFHLTTTECMGAIRSLLADDGVLVINIISEIHGELFAGIYSSIAAHFPNVMIYPATYPNSAAVRQNVMIVALCSETIPERAPESDYMASLLAHRWTAPYEPRIAAFTDAFAPVEKYSLIR
ncbi:fused MFS/spermidine synthase [Synergistaceae bacterium OttesenSCG-928-I11]|nr:fused MFS/spermidine synthase [Synergistaceae bacterium OttesenSCG-928-I11]